MHVRFSLFTDFDVEIEIAPADSQAQPPFTLTQPTTFTFGPQLGDSQRIDQVT
jgi:hypothetical protein